MGQGIQDSEKMRAARARLEEETNRTKKAPVKWLLVLTCGMGLLFALFLSMPKQDLYERGYNLTVPFVFLVCTVFGFKCWRRDETKSSGLLLVLAVINLILFVASLIMK